MYGPATSHALFLDAVHAVSAFATDLRHPSSTNSRQTRRSRVVLGVEVGVGVYSMV
jgi:hypothetical protein